MTSNGVSAWQPYEDGATIGMTGSEGGVILRDEEHVEGARITLEQGTRFQVPFAITCGIYGWLVHTRFIADEPTAQHEFEQMLAGLDEILHLLPDSDEGAISAAIAAFTERYA